MLHRLPRSLTLALRLVILVALLFSLLPAGTVLAWTDSQNAALVLGQANYTANTAALTQTGMNHPQAVAVDPVNGAVFVADPFNNRVLRFASLEALASGAPAVGVLGQPDFVHNDVQTTRFGMNDPVGLTISSQGTLFVADAGNHRVLRFYNAAFKSNGAAADGVLGQVNYSSNAAGLSASQFNNPVGLAYDSATNTLFVADCFNHRVLRFYKADQRADGTPADGVLGQTNFTSNTPAVSQGGMQNPMGVAYDYDSGRLWVADTVNNRVLRFENALNTADYNGDLADGVIGQTSYTASAAATDLLSLRNPTSVSVDIENDVLWVADHTNHRVVRFTFPAAQEFGGSIDTVLGQANGFSASPTVAQNRMSLPFGVFADNFGKVWVADSGNNRVLVFQDGVSVEIKRAGPDYTSADSVTFNVKFSGPVASLATHNFVLEESGSLVGASITGVSGGPTLWQVTVNTGTGQGTLRLDMVTAAGLGQDLNFALPYQSGEVYTVGDSLYLPYVRK